MFNSYQAQMWQPFFGQRMMPSYFLGSFLFLLVPFMILELILKGIALWKAGRNNQPVWFVALLLINTLGILPIVYLVFFQVKRVATAASEMTQPARRTTTRKRK